MQKLTRSLLALGVLAGLAACGDDVSVTQPPPVTPAVTGITVSPNAATLIKGQTAQLSAVVTANDPSVAKTVTWASSNAAVATVSATGLVTAVAPGAATITATSTADANFKAGAQITVTGLGVRSVRVSPDNAIVPTGSTLQLVANVDADAGVARTVTWASSNAAVATVSTSGVVTGVSAGTAAITATSTVDNTVSGAAAITVRNPTPATVSIASITTGTLGTPVNVNNVAGQIEVTLNVDPGDQVVSSVEVLIDGVPVVSQSFSSSRNVELALSHVFENVQAAPVTLSINTAAFDAATGAVKFFNGTRKISARANVQGGTQVSTPSQDLTFNNVSGVVLTVANDNGSDPKTATNPAQGLTWMGGSLTVTVVGVSYAQGATITSVTLGNFGGGPFLGKTGSNVVALTATTAPAGYSGGGSSGSITYDEAAGTWSSTNSRLGGYQTATTITVAPNPAVTGEAPVAVATLLSNGQNGPANTLNFPANALGNANVPVVPIVRMDNNGPGLTSANGVAQVALTTAAMPIWVNAATSFAAGQSGIPTTSTLNASDIGSDLVTVAVYVGAAGSLPSGANPGGVSPSCSVTGLQLVTVGADLAATIVSTSYQGRVIVKDGLGNINCLDLNPIDPLAVANGTFGADFVAPTGSIAAGPGANSAFTSAGAVGNYSISASDNASGFGPNPLMVVVKRSHPALAGACVIGTGTSCTSAARPLAFDPLNAVAAPTNEGYYDVTIDLLDQAGNSVNLITNRVFLLDDPAQIAPGATADIGFSGGISLPSLIAGATTNNFSATVRDDIDLASVFGVTTYPTADIQYPSQSLGTYGLPHELGGSAINYAVANWMRCINVAGDFATTTNQPTVINLTVADQAGNTTTLASPAFGANAQACGAVGDATINTFGPIVATFPTGKTQIDLDGASLATASSETVTLSAVADVPLNTSVSPFTRVDFYFQDLAGNLRAVGSATGTLTQTPTNRTWTFTFVWNPDAATVQVGAVTIVAIGVDSQGDAVLTATASVTTVP